MKKRSNQIRQKPAYLLAIDIGNSSTSYGLFKGIKLLASWHGEIDIIPKISRFIISSSINKSDIQVIIDSVNPFTYYNLKRRIRSISSKSRPWVVGENLKVKIRHKYIKINKLGSDRLVNIDGAIRRYRCPILIFDFGTATTADVIGRTGVFEGGLIIPGIETSWEALQAKAALLPKLKLQKSASLLGHDTKSCMTAGALQGFGAMVDGLIQRFRRSYGSRLTVIATGGLANLIRPYLSVPVIVDPNHTLKSLALIYQNYIHS